MTFHSWKLVGALAAAALLTACSGPVLSKIEVKATPTINAVLGTAEALLSDSISVAVLRDKLGDTNGLQVYDYDDGTGTQTFAIRYPLTSVELDFGEYMKDIGLEDSLGDALTPMSFPVPDVNKTSSTKASFNVNDTVRQLVNDGFGSPTATFVETGLSNQTATIPPISITVNEFDTATFSAGSLNIALSLTGASANLALSGTVRLLDSSDNPITDPSNSVNLKTGGTAVVPLTGKTLTSTFKVQFTATTSGGTALKQITINATPSLSSDSVMSAATGVDFTTTVTVPTSTVSLGADATFSKAVVGDGDLKLDFGSLPATWTGVTRSTTLTVAQSGGLNLSPAAITTATATLPLDNQTISKNDLAINATTVVTASNASFSGLTAASTELEVKSEFAVAQFGQVTVVPGSSFKPITDFSDPISQQMQDWVNWINFTEVGVQIEFTNNLPAGNDMTINAVSTAFGISGAAKPLSSNATTTVKFTNATNFVPKNHTNLDFKVTLTPQTYNSTSGELTLYNIVPGTTLSFSGTVKLISDWDQANIAPPAGGYQGSYPETGETDLSAMAELLGDGISFGNIDTRLYLSGLDSGSNFTGHIQASYTEDGTGKTLDLLGSSGTPATITMLASPLNLPTGEVLAPADLPATASATLTGLDTVLNAKPADLTLDYTLNANSITVSKADVNDGTTAKKLEADLVVIFPLSLIAGPNATLDVASYMPEDDLFGREASKDNKSINDAIKSLQSITLKVKIDNTMGLAGTVLLKDRAGGFEKPFELTAATTTQIQTITIDRSDVEYILDTVPFEIALEVGVPAGTYNVKRGGGITAHLTISAAASIDQTFEFGGNN